MKLSTDKIERLVFSKYLLTQAGKHKELDRPLSSSSILLLHDLVECFLQLASEHLLNKPKLSANNILDIYSEELNKYLLTKGYPTINKAFIKRLNELRNQLKHSTIFIDKKNIDNLYSETELFIKDFTNVFFDIQFEDITLVQLISNKLIKDHLEEAEKKIQDNEFHTALFSIGKAFYELEQTERHLPDKQGINVLREPNRVNYLIRHDATFNAKPLENFIKATLRDIGDDINKINKNIFSLTTVLSLSVDIKDYFRFQTIMPYVTKIQTHRDNKWYIEFWIPNEESYKKEDFTIQQVMFCFNFVLDVALKSQR